MDLYFSIFATMISLISIVISIASNRIAKNGNEIAKSEFDLNKQNQKPVLVVETENNKAIALNCSAYDQFEAETQLYAKYSGIYFGEYIKNSIVISILIKNIGIECVDNITLKQLDFFTKDCVNMSDIDKGENHFILRLCDCSNEYYSQDVFLPKDCSVLVHFFIPLDDDNLESFENFSSYPYSFLKIRMGVQSMLNSHYEEALDIDLYTDNGSEFFVRKLIPYVQLTT